jgi:hypothetical protein
MGEVRVRIEEMARATSVPSGAIRKMIDQRMIVAENIGKGDQKHYLIPVSQQGAIPEQYERLKAMESEARSRAAQSQNRVRTSDLEDLRARVERIEQELGMNQGGVQVSS